jgi:anti-anti-sigma factor
MEITNAEIDAPVAVIHLTGQFWEDKDFTLFSGKVRDLLDIGITLFITDLSRVSFISSQALGLFISLHKEIHETGGRFVLYQPAGCVKEVIEISGVAKAMKIVYSEEEIAAFKRSIA